MFNFVDAATPDGVWLIGTNMPRRFLGTALPSYAVLRNLRTGELRTMAPLATPRSQILAASADDRWVVWSETDDPNLFDWRLMVYDRTTGRVHELDHAVIVNGQPSPGPSPWPVVSHGIVVWGQATAPMQPGGATIDKAAVRMADLATGTITTIATSALGPAFSWPWVAWQRGGTTALGPIEAKNLRSGATVTVDATYFSLSMDGTTLAFNDPASKSISIVTDLSAHAQPQLLASAADIADHLEWPSVNDRLVAWVQTSTTQVYDRAERRLVALSTRL